MQKATAHHHVIRPEEFISRNSKVSSIQLLTFIAFAMVLLLTPLKRLPDLPNPEIPIVLHPVAPVPILKNRLSEFSSASFSKPFKVQAGENVPSLSTSELLAPVVSAQTIYLMDYSSMAILYERDADKIVSPASTTKLMTALVALELYSLDEIVTVKSGAGLDGASAGLFYGEELTVASLLKATLIHSANDAAWTLAEHHAGGVTGFVEAMNIKARELNLTNTSFMNPVGYDHPEHTSTARDLAILTHAALQKQTISEIVVMQSANITDRTGTTTHRLATTNELLKSDPTIRGVKTGTTEQAGQVLITLADRAEHPVILVLLGSQDRFAETTTLLTWVYNSYEWVDLAELRAQN